MAHMAHMISQPADRSFTSSGDKFLELARECEAAADDPYVRKLRDEVIVLTHQLETSQKEKAELEKEKAELENRETQWSEMLTKSTDAKKDAENRNKVLTAQLKATNTALLQSEAGHRKETAKSLNFPEKVREQFATLTKNNAELTNMNRVLVATVEDLRQKLEAASQTGVVETHVKESKLAYENVKHLVKPVGEFVQGDPTTVTSNKREISNAIDIFKSGKKEIKGLTCETEKIYKELEAHLKEITAQQKAEAKHAKHVADENAKAAAVNVSNAKAALKLAQEEEAKAKEEKAKYSVPKKPRKQATKDGSAVKAKAAEDAEAMAVKESDVAKPAEDAPAVEAKAAEDAEAMAVEESDVTKPAEDAVAKAAEDPLPVAKAAKEPDVAMAVEESDVANAAEYAEAMAVQDAAEPSPKPSSESSRRSGRKSKKPEIPNKAIKKSPIKKSPIKKSPKGNKKK